MVCISTFPALRQSGWVHLCILMKWWLQYQLMTSMCEWVINRLDTTEHKQNFQIPSNHFSSLLLPQLPHHYLKARCCMFQSPRPSLESNRALQAALEVSPYLEGYSHFPKPGLHTLWHSHQPWTVAARFFFQTSCFPALADSKTKGSSSHW